MSKKHKDNPFNETAAQEEQAAEQEAVQQENSEEDTLRADFDALNNQYIRLAADFENYRKRQAQEHEALLKYGAQDALKKMIEVLDNFDRGSAAIQNVEECQPIKDSFDMIHKQVIDTLTKMGLEEIDAQGKEFDPNFHEAVMQTPTDEHPENTVIKVLQKGYKLGDKVLRPAMVNVATKGEA